MQKSGYVNHNKEKNMLKYWSNAFMTTGAAIIATAVFTEYIYLGLIIGGWGIGLGAFLCYLSLLKGEK